MHGTRDFYEMISFVVYSLTWLGLIIAFGALAALLFGLLGMGQFAGIVALPAGLMFSTVFYVSLLFTFNDSFGGAQGRDTTIDSDLA